MITRSSARRTLQVAALLTLLLAGTSAPAAAQGQWVQRGPLGAEVQSIAIDPQTPTTVYAATRYGGIFRSHDAGVNWTPVNRGLTNPFVQVLAIDPQTPGVLYAGTEGGMFRSFDGGGQWTAVNAGIPEHPTRWIRAIAIDPQAPATVYAGASAVGVFRSTDRGATWTAINDGLTNLSIHALVLDPHTPSTLYAATFGAGIFRTTDAGASWTPMNGGLPELEIRSLAVDPQTPSTVYALTVRNGVFRSTNAGNTWTAINTGLPTPLSFSAIAVHPQTPATLYLTSAHGFYRSLNSGASWTAAASGLPATEVQTVAIDPLTPTNLYVGTFRSGLFRTVNAAATWVAANTGLAGYHVTSLAVDRQAPGRLYAGTHFGVWRSVDSGLTWSPTNIWSIEALALDAVTQDPSIVYAAVNRVYRSLDGALTWTGLETGLQGSVVWALAIDPATPSRLYAGTPEGVFRSDDFGVTWTGASAGLTFPDVRTIAIDPQTPSTLYAGTRFGGVFRSSNGGSSWTRVTTGLTNGDVRSLVINPQAPSVVYAATPAGVFRTMDGGNLWSSVNAGLALTTLDARALAIDPDTPATVYAGIFDSGVFRSLDAGASWAPLNTGLPDVGRKILALSIDPVTPSIVYAATSGSSLLRWTQTPAVTLMEPAIVARGFSTQVTLTGANFLSGATSITAPAGVTVSNVHVINATVLTATLSVDATAGPGVRNLSVVTPHASSNSLSFTLADPFPDLVVTTSQPETFGEGFDETYAVTVRNVGTAATVEPITVTSTLAPGLTFVSSSGAGWSCTASSQSVTCVRATSLPVGASSTVTLTVAIDGASDVIDHIVAVSTAGDLNGANNSSSRQTTVAQTPTPRIEFSAASLGPGQQLLAGITLPAPFPHQISGVLTMVFTPDPSDAADDPAIQFATGGRHVTFVIEANTLEARFAGSLQAGPIGFQTGTVAGAFTFTAAVSAGRVQLTVAPSVAPEALRIPRSAPRVHAIDVRSEGGFAAHVLLSATSREITRVSLQFATSRNVQLSCGAATGCAVSGTTITLDVAALFGDWFSRNPEYGSLSTLRLPLVLDGSLQGTVLIRLHNSHGVSPPASFPLP